MGKMGEMMTESQEVLERIYDLAVQWEDNPQKLISQQHAKKALFEAMAGYKPKMTLEQQIEQTIFNLDGQCEHTKHRKNKIDCVKCISSAISNLVLNEWSNNA